jgi:AcrR family transcriptional regulator
MGHKYTRDELLAGALATALDGGLSELTFGRVAKRLGVSDRIVVYYFPTKSDLIGEVVSAMGAGLQVALAEAFAEPAADHAEIVRRAWPVLAAQDHERVFALFFEANGLAAIGLEPYATIVPQLVEEWIEWVAALLVGTADERRAGAEAAIAVLDGLFLLRLLAGAEAADRAAAALGVR